MDKHINKTELLNFLNGNCDEQEAFVINQFLKTDAGQYLLNDLLNEHWSFANERYLDKVKHSAWKKEWSLKFKEEQQPAKMAKLLQFKGFFRYAAVFAVLLLGIGIYNIMRKPQTEANLVESKLLVQSNPAGTRSNFILNDGTRVYLGPGSALSYPVGFLGNKREVRLKGEAYFEVKKDKTKPFIIYTKDLRTQVLGTTFKVASFEALPIVVAVTSGRVRVDRMEGSHFQELAMLRPGEQVVYSNGKAQKSNFNVETLKNWKKGELVFNGTSLSEVCSQISRWYNVSIDIRSKALKEETITVTLDGNMPVDKFLKVLSVSFNFNYTIHNHHITIY